METATINKSSSSLKYTEWTEKTSLHHVQPFAIAFKLNMMKSTH